MRFKIIIFLLIIVNLYCQAQIQKVCGKDFDYKTLSPKDTFSLSSEIPPYYVCCTYLSGRLCEINIFMKEEWMREHQQVHAKVICDNEKTFFVYDEGYIRVGAGRYQRLFPKKTKITDTAMLVNDTLIFKNKSKYRYAIHFITNLYSDSIVINDYKVYPIEKRDISTISSSSFSNYLEWFSDSTFSRFYKSVIFLRAEHIINHIRIKDPVADYTFKDRYSRAEFEKRRMPISFFWIKHSGMIY